MRAAVWTGIGNPLEVQELTLQPPKAGEVKVAMKASGVCYTDVSASNGTLPQIAPMVLGHEGAGIVEEIGDGVTTVAVGDHVVTSWVGQCGQCYTCTRNQSNLCESSFMMQAMGAQLDGTPRFELNGEPVNQFCATGTFAEASILPQFSVTKIDPAMPLEYACLLGCGVLTGVGAVINTAKIEPGSTVAVVGPGGVGLSVIQGARIAGAAQIIAVGRDDDKLELARTLGATHVVNAANDDPVAAVKKLTGTTAYGGLRGVDYAFEAVGRSTTVQQCLDMTRRGGTVVFLGVPSMTDKLDLNLFSDTFFNAKVLTGSYFGGANIARDVPELVRMYQAGDLKLAEMVSGKIELDDVNDALRSLTKGGGSVARNVIIY